MGSCKILFSRSAEKELRQVPSDSLRKVLSKIEALSKDPRPSGCQLLKGDDRYYRIRHGEYGVIYEVADDAQVVMVIKIGHRREVYS